MNFRKRMVLIWLVFMLISLTSCSGGESEAVEEAEDSNPTTVRGTANISMEIPSITNAYFEAELMEFTSDQTKEDAVVVSTATKEEVSHQNKLSTQWDFRVTAPNYVSDNTYYVNGVLYADSGKGEVLLRGKCKEGVNRETTLDLCTVMGQGKLTNFYMDLVPAEEY